jgi:hypothetical protein
MCVCDFDWSLFGNVISGVGSVGAAFFTILIYFLAKQEWKHNNSISEFDTYYKLKNDLGSEYAMRMYSSLAKGKLSLGDNQGEKVITNNGKPEEDIGYFNLAFLGHFEDLSMLYDKELISFELLNSGYGSMILVVGNDPFIVDLIKYLRGRAKDGDDSYFGGFENLYKEIRLSLTLEKQEFYRKDFNS